MSTATQLRGNPMATLLAKNADVVVTMDGQRRELKNAGMFAHDGDRPSGVAVLGPAAEASGGVGPVRGGVPRSRGAYRVRAMVPGGRPDRGAAGLEAEHDRPAAALPGGVPVRALGTDAAADGKDRPAVLARSVYRQRHQRGAAQLAGALDEQRFRLVDRAAT